jgi:phenylalanyl-tRNA synthetase beta subunit (EC 6.1.1.20)
VITGNRFDDQWSNETQALDFYDIKSDVESLLSLTTNTFTFKAAEHPALQKGQTAQILIKRQCRGLGRYISTSRAKAIVFIKMLFV